MDKVLEISPADSLARVQPGVITEEFQRAVERENLFYPPDPASLKNSTLGGNVAENAGGPRCLKYGVTKNYVLGLTAVLPSGEILRTGSRTLKNVVGYDLTSLLVGSEGTLALITEITLKLIPLPESRGVIRLGFPSVKEAVEATVQILGSGVLPSAMEFLDQSALTEVSRFLNIPVPEGTTSLLILELDGRKEAIHADMETLLSLVGPRTTEREFSFDPSQMESLWTMRRQISPTITNLGLHKVNEDIVVPRSRLSEAVEWINGLAKEHDVKVVLFGHIGDGNIHTNFLLRPEQLPLTETLLTALFTKVVSWGGVLSGEHGVGIAKRPYLSLQLSQPEIELMRGVKRVWDPQNLLNPGKIF
ncbi:MAG: putative FAD-linked oxidoreductase [Candidatus Aminicenantes bacterium ADurb.Bin508]|nr:MAG: putative FAD-linked oxidoreductase [Candidatus Aminicenantes bacterium ADurb.Bin508]